MTIRVYTKERGVRRLRDGVTLEQYQERFPNAIRVHLPTMATVENWSDTGIARAMDGCHVEPDGNCPHGYPSWMLVLGVI